MAERNPYSRQGEFDERARKGESDPGDVANEARERATEMAGQAQERAGEVMDRAGRQVNSALAGQKSQAAGSMESIAHAVRQTGQQLREQDQAGIAEYADRAADQMESFSRQLRERDVSDLVGEVESFARRQPALFLGGALLLGFMGARFLKSSGQQAGPDYSQDAYWRDPYATRYGPGAGRTFGAPGTYGTEGEAGYRDPAPFRPRGSILPRQHEEVLGPETPASEEQSRSDEPRGTVRRWPSGETPTRGSTPQTGPFEDTEEK
jgi:hypothetical protein